jgi:hypothetical protein
MNDLRALALDVIQTCLPETRLTDHDAEVVARNKRFLLDLETGLVATFYDTLYAHGPTAAVFVEGERPAREDTLRVWWRRTVNGPLDDAYFAWMALVGVIHNRRGVQNPMMLSMLHLVTDAVHAAAMAELGPDEAEELRVALSHLASTVAAVISESYTSTYIGALQDLAGLNPKLTDRLLKIELKDLEAKGRLEIAS